MFGEIVVDAAQAFKFAWKPLYLANCRLKNIEPGCTLVAAE
jgi:hypothetical protein